ncbi:MULTISPECIES: L-lactate MFS transporter [Brenneria]|uniref:MFS transporter n=1 Tax=Brenneria nigrifluens DSM 30175 = ATCC 13028 TaxID=1121120 RepID=A0A2U1USY7_9GAMM|nr:MULTISPECIES: OFA family MFS transporter [Brenneria]EHD21694.1 major facilitator superfamily MFS_1 [Brenneria sp. EniD312]PWC24768.1 MFS transporter [Brenneria nigrifluens] [Brenneria nigrifluens DSM 30175 = ATCC 13028]QCR04809.1 MFS transporter [Brenneria nigrifluens] [Brenneria nigrifluens DSM 30175 = ATCC 13028]
MNAKPVNRGMIVLGTVIAQMGLGTIYTWSLFNQPLVDKFGWSLSSVAVTFSITSFCLAVATLFAGKFQERIGIRRLTLFAGMALGLGLMASAGVSSLSLFYILMGMVVGFADGTAYIITLSNLIKWFPERKGLIAGISVGAFGTGSLLFKYVNSFLIAEVGVSQAFFYWGIIVMAMITLGSSLLKEPNADSVATSPASQRRAADFSLGEMLAVKESYLLFIIFFTACMSGLYLIGIVKDIGVQMAGMDMATAANAVSAIAIFNTVGRIVLGAISDKMSRLRVISFTLLVTAIAVSVMTFLPLNPLLFFACVSAVAFCFGGNITIFPAIVGDFFGMKNHSKNYGVIYQGFGIGALSGSFIATQLGGFHATFVAIIVMSLVSFMITLWVKPPKLQRSPSVKATMAHAQS